MHGPLRSASITRMGAEKSFIETVAVTSVSWMARPVNWRIPCRSVMVSSRLRRLCMIIIWSLEPETARSGESSYSKIAVSNLRAVLHYAVLLLKALLLFATCYLLSNKSVTMMCNSAFKTLTKDIDRMYNKIQMGIAGGKKQKGRYIQ